MGKPFFYINKLSAKGENKKDSIIEFKKGLNIITDKSNTGKTCILNCIKYMFGADKNKFPLKETGYTLLEMNVIVNDKYDVLFKRAINSNKVEVISNYCIIESGTYNVIKPKKDLTKWINNVYLKLIGIDYIPNIIANKNGTNIQSLSFKNIFSKLLYINENDIITPESIILNKSRYMEETSLLSTLLFLITGNDFFTLNNIENINSKKIKLAVNDYIQKQIDSITSDIESLNSLINDFDENDITSLDLLNNQLSEITLEIKDALENYNDILNNNIILTKTKEKQDITLEKYKTLRKQYISDINRINFIIDGQVNINYTNNMIIETGKNELEKLTALLIDLDNLIQKIIDNTSLLNENIKNNNLQLSNIQSNIDNLLKPKANEINEKINNYNELNEAKHELNFLKNYKEKYTLELNNVHNNEQKDNIDYHPKNYFDLNFIETLNTYFSDILKECNYDNLTYAYFDINTFDIIINGKEKASNNGKGYNAFLNTITALAFRKYFYNQSKYNPSLLIIDSPLLGLDLGDIESTPLNMRKGLFEYFINNQIEGQMIVVENSVSLPDINYGNVNITNFTNNSRNGFLIDL